MPASWTTQLEIGRQALLSWRAVAGERRPREAAPVTPWGQPSNWRSALPAPDQELLLKAALLADDRGAQAWAQLSPRLDIDALDAGAWPVLPMLYRNLSAVAPAEPVLSRLRGIRRFLWAQNQLLLGELMPLVAELEASGIQTVLLKGAALLTQLDDPGLRPMSDLDVLIPEAARRPALDLLGRSGLVPLGGLEPDWVEWVIAPTTPGYSMRTSAGRELDLHWHAMHQARQPGADAELWAGARPVKLAGVATRVPDPADQLLHTVCHSMRWDPRPSYRWVVDAWQLLGQPIDFERLVEQARRRRLAVPAHLGLTYLVSRFGAPIPASAIQALRRSRGSLLERAELKAVLTAPSDQGSLARAVLEHQSHIRRHASEAQRLTPVGHVRLAARALRADPAPISPRPEVRVEHPVRFGRGQNPAPHVVRGMGPPEDGGCWTVGREARLVLPLAGPVDRGRVLVIGAQPYVHPAHRRQRLLVIANGRAVARWTGSAEGPTMRRAIVLSPSVIAGGVVDLRLRTPDARSPSSLGAGDDVRELGWFLREITVTAIEPYELGTELRFDADQGADRHLVGGWWPGEPAGRWTATRQAGLAVRVQTSAEALQLELEAATLAAAGERHVRVAVLVNGRAEAVMRLDAGRPDARGRVTLSGVTAGAEIELALRVRRTASPRDLGLGDDERQLGLFLRRLMLGGAPGPGRRPAAIRWRRG